MTLKHLPPTFCWTKIGTESGEELPAVVLRKEWERRLGGGRFLWGINQPLGSSAQVAAHRTGSLLALFSPVASRTRPGERKREDARNLLILHMLRKQVGNAAFDEAFRTLYADPASPPIDLGRFKHVFELTSGKHLDFFFGQWLGNDRAPSFSLEDVTVTPRSKTLFEISGNVVQPLPAYYLTLPIVVRTTSHNVLYNLPIRSSKTFFHLAVHQPPRELLVDPLHDVLAAPVAVEDLSAR